ncbi:MAG TPA: hypothetical protein VMR70_20980 [Flavisolibacter sp.]|nr:hypothetical protein [Flavisolibacter sp.]
MSWKRLREKMNNWELWPFNLIYAPIGPLWLWYAVKARCFWWFTPANPTLTFAGFEGEGKKEMYDLLPEELYPATIYVSPTQSFEEIKTLVAEKGLQYPICVKPEIGLKGLLFRKVDNEEKLKIYHEKVPVDYIIQSLVEAPLEVSVFYYRYPDQQKGVISGFIQKEMMHLFGDGKRPLWELILQHPKAKHRLEEMRIKHEQNLETVLPSGEKYILTHAANLNRGARFTNLHAQIDEQLHSIFDPLSHRCSWYYGRYDLKCNSIEELKQGKFIVLEFNGAGAEPNHVYNAGFSWGRALSEFAHHWKVLYEIGKYNHKHKSVRYWGNREGYKWLLNARAHGQLLEKYDREILI